MGRTGIILVCYGFNAYPGTNTHLPKGGIIRGLDRIMQLCKERVWFGVDGDEVRERVASLQPHNSVRIVDCFHERGLKLRKERLKHWSCL